MKFLRQKKKENKFASRHTERPRPVAPATRGRGLRPKSGARARPRTKRGAAPTNKAYAISTKKKKGIRYHKHTVSIATLMLLITSIVNVMMIFT